MSKRIEELLEEYSSNRKQYTGEKHFKFLKKVFKAFKEVGALNISFIYYTLNSNSPKIMDSEFMKAYIESMLKDNHTLINIFVGYWENNRGLELTEGLNVNFNMILKEEEVFAALIANNDLEKVLQLLSITNNRIKSLTQDTSEDLFYSKCLSDYEREDFKNAVSGLQFFGFGKNKELTEDDIKLYSKLNTKAFSAIKDVFKKIKEDNKDISSESFVKKQISDEEDGTWMAFVKGKEKSYTIATIEDLDQDERIKYIDEIIKESNKILSDEDLGSKILSIGGDGDEGIIEIDMKIAKINFDNLK
jgi:hypothetical protein